MAKTPSTMLPLGTKAPPFSLPDTEGKTQSLTDLAGPKGTLVMFLCNHCPFVVHVAAELARLGNDLPAQGISVIAINSNDAEAFPDDRPEKMRTERAKRGYSFPYLFDATQGVAKAYQAACTPDFFLFDAAGKLAYRGQLDGSRPSNDVPVTGKDLRAAAAAVASGKQAEIEQTPSIGCNIKWRPGNAPAYYP